MTKERILQFIDYKKIKPSIFLVETGIKRGFLDKDKLEGSVSDEHFAKIIATYPEINIEWLITGRGEMLRNNTNQTIPNSQNTHISDREMIIKDNAKCILCEEKDKRIGDLKKQIENLEKHVVDLNKYMDNFAIEIKKPLEGNTRGSDYTMDSTIIIPQQHQKEKNRL